MFDHRIYANWPTSQTCSHHAVSDLRQRLYGCCRSSLARPIAQPHWSHAPLSPPLRLRIQIPVCNDRNSGPIWDVDLQIGFFQGCTARPVAGSRYCKAHQALCHVAPEEATVAAHREVVGKSGIALEYWITNEWRSADGVPVPQIRAYEMSLLRSRSIKADGDVSCSKDERKGDMSFALPLRGWTSGRWEGPA